MADKPLVCYYFTSSFYAQKALCALDEKGVPYTTRKVNFIENEHTSPSYMRLNRNGTVPCLTHGDIHIEDSQDIIHYLEDTFPGVIPDRIAGLLLPSVDEPKYRSDVIHCQERLDSLNIPILTFGSLSNRHLTKDSKVPEPVAKRMNDGMVTMNGPDAIARLEKLAEENPDLADAYHAKIQAWRVRTEQMANTGTGIPAAVLERELEHARTVLGEMDERIASKYKPWAGFLNDWLCGPDYTEADIILAVTLNRLKYVGYAYLWEDGKMPHIERFFERAKQRMSFKKYCANATFP